MDARESPLTLHRSPGAGFDQPFEMLHACHERVERTLRLLQRLRAHLNGPGCDESARQAARDVMRYFDVAAPAHHEDEERHVFPALLQAGRCVEVVTRLQREHDEMRGLWPQVRDILLRVVDGPWHGFAADDESQLEQFARLYDWHLAAENELAFPAAMAVMTPQSRAAMSDDMAARRGVGWAPGRDTGTPAVAAAGPVAAR